MDTQVLDSMDIERERGITIKAQSVTLDYQAKDGQTYQLNFIDTPGHVDFSYEVSRSLAACEGALLVVDAGQGVEAQSVANCYTAIEQGLEVLPILNKMDLPQADPEKVQIEIEEIIGIDATDAVPVSAKTGMGIEDALECLVRKIPPPEGDLDAPRRRLLLIPGLITILAWYLWSGLNTGFYASGIKSSPNLSVEATRWIAWVFLRPSDWKPVSFEPVRLGLWLLVSRIFKEPL